MINENFEFYNKQISQESAIDNISEVIPEVPAYQYSSGILFPQTSIQVNTRNDIQTENIEISETDYENTSADDDSSIEDTTESLISKQQNYPNQFGLSFVVNGNTDLQNDLSIILKFRKYNRVSKKECINKKICIFLSEYQNEIEYAIENFFNDYFQIQKINNNVFVVINKEILNDNFYTLDYKNLNNFINSFIIEELKNCFKDITEQKNKDDISLWGLKKDEENFIWLYSLSTKSYGDKNYEDVVTLYENSIEDYIQNSLNQNIKNYNTYKEFIKKYEVYKQLKIIILDLKSIFKSRNATPIWQSKQYCKEIKLPKYDVTKKIDRQSPISIDVSDENIQKLFYCVQYIQKSDCLYVKIIFINKYEIKLKASEPPQLNKKDEANNKSFFGIDFKITENKPNILCQYNPPHLLDIDDEDNFNKLLYREYIDYGEGYNTSVDWGKEDGKIFIKTDYLPHQDVPKVDYIPSKLEDNKLAPRIKDDQVLSMRYLSTLSNEEDDNKIYKALKDFVDEYNIWIEEKKESLININEKELLSRQILACKKDYKRLLRNIRLLRENKEAMTAFRLMNTAMFMQLHHSILIKNNSSDLNNKLDEKYYKNIELKYDYKWRSFQLAFILLNIDAFVRPSSNDNTIEDVFGTGWPERNEIADLVWFPTGGGKTEAYLGIIAFCISYRRFSNKEKGFGTTVLMRYTLRLLTQQQFQRATLLICALEAIRKDKFNIPYKYSLGEKHDEERITIGLFVGSDSLPNKWSGNEGMYKELTKIYDSVKAGREFKTGLLTKCPWCGNELYIENDLSNVYPNFKNDSYGIDDKLSICCNNKNCTFYNNRPLGNNTLPLRLFDEDIYKYPPTLIFGTVDKFAALANKVSSYSNERNQDSRRLLGKGYKGRNQNRDFLPPELIIQDELHLLLGPLGTAVGLFEKGIDMLCTYEKDGQIIRPKIVTSTATTRNTDKQIFALFNRRSEIFPKQGVTCDDSFFAYYARDDHNQYKSNRKYIGLLPVGKTQVWMQLRVASISLAHRLKYIKAQYSLDELLNNDYELKDVFNYYHTVLSYFNSLKDVGKTQSQLNHYLPGDLNYIIKNTIPWSFLDVLMRNNQEIEAYELTGRLTGEEVKTNLSKIEKKWELVITNEEQGTKQLNSNNPPEFVVATNMISVGIDVSRFNTMIISSMPRNIAEYIQASSRVARDEKGIVFTVHHPFRSRDISHYQKFKEFHEKFYSYVEPISVTPFATKALDRYLAMFCATILRHNTNLGLMNNDDANNNIIHQKENIKKFIIDEIEKVKENAEQLDQYLSEREEGLKSNIVGIIENDEISDLEQKIDFLLNNWIKRLEECNKTNPQIDLKFRDENNPFKALFISIADSNYPYHWKVSHSLREIDPSTVIKTVQQ